MREVNIITDHKPLVVIYKKDVATLSQRIQWILLRIHQYRVKIIYKLDPDLFMADWLSRQSHKEGKDEQIEGMQVNINNIKTSTDIPECMMIWELQDKTNKTIIYNNWKNASEKDSQKAKKVQHKPQGVLDISRWHGIISQGHSERWCIVIPNALQKQALEQLHINHMVNRQNKTPCP